MECSVLRFCAPSPSRITRFSLNHFRLFFPANPLNAGKVEAIVYCVQVLADLDLSTATIAGNHFTLNTRKYWYGRNVCSFSS